MGKYIAYLQKSTNSKKKWMVTIFKDGNKVKTVHFGATGYSDYTIHKDKNRMGRYDNRHKSRENWTISGITTAGFWSKWILWSKPSLSGAITYTKNKFGIDIKKRAPPSGRSTRIKSNRRRGGRSTSPKPTNLSLYNKVKNEAKRKFKVWPSAYASGWLVKEYKRRGGTYSGEKDSSFGIDRWFKEEWINVCKLPKIVKCGRPKTNFSDWKKDYPYCRPRYKINKGTPVIASKLTKKQIESRCKSKKKNPLIRISPRRKKK
tara:strand:- start:272 stop:1054 length:783 start_codon:yes stop_codon:yes gene_type:complete